MKTILSCLFVKFVLYTGLQFWGKLQPLLFKRREFSKRNQGQL